MSANFGHIDLNSDLVSGDRESGDEGVSLTEPLDNPSNELLPGVADVASAKGELEEEAEPVNRGTDGVCEVKLGGRADDASSVTVIGVSESKACRGDGMEGVNGSGKGLGSSEDATKVDDEGLVLKSEDFDGNHGALSAHLMRCCQANREAVEIPNGSTKGIVANDLHGELGMEIHECNPAITENNEEVTRTSETQDGSGEIENSQNAKQCGVEEVSATVCSSSISEARNIHSSDTVVSADTMNGSNSFSIVVDLNPKVGVDGDDSNHGDAKSGIVEYSVSDLVWGKVMSHPWWPAQIIDPSTSSRKAKKHFKEDRYLVAYFGDQTFAWNKATLLKPFLEHFSQLEKQSDSEEFLHAVNCALEEVSRRVEYGLGCPCLPEEVYSKLKTQVIVNAGVRKESSRRDGGDSSLAVTYFDPLTLVKSIKALAKFPHGEADKIEMVIARAQVIAFYRWKGYNELPEFKMLGDLWENDADIPPEDERERDIGLVKVAVTDNEADEDVLSKEINLRSQDRSSRKRKRINVDAKSPSKKEKSLSDLMARNAFDTANGDQEPERSGTGGLISRSSGKKRVELDASSEETGKHGKGRVSKTSVSKPLQANRTFRVGDSIQRVATKLSGPSPLQKQGDVTSHRTAVKSKGRAKISEKQPSEEDAKLAYPSLDEAISQLCFTARDPVNSCGLTSSMVTFISEFRNSVSSDYGILKKQQQSPEQVSGGRTGEKSMDTEKTTEVEAEKSTEGLDNSEEDLSPTALILNFTNMDSVPSETGLNRIFSSYGDIRESETEVQRKSKRAKVVFRRRSDAEKAFSSTGKYSCFGPSLASYSIAPNTPTKASPRAAKRHRIDVASSFGGNQD